MTPNRPYLLRALFEWICDNGCTPYLLVDATLEGVDVPLEHVTGGRIVLNASGSAVVNFEISDEAVSFSTRFSGRDTWIFVPMAAVLAIYAKETQEGMTFAPADYPDRRQRPEYRGDEADGVENLNDAEEVSGGKAEHATAVGPASDAPSVAQKPASQDGASAPGTAKKRGEANHLKVIK